MSNGTTTTNSYNPKVAIFNRDTYGNSRIIVSIPYNLTVQMASQILGGQIATNKQIIELVNTDDNYSKIELSLIFQTPGGIQQTIQSIQKKYQDFLAN